MYFNKVETTNNFVFNAAECTAIAIEDHGANVFRVQVDNARWPDGTHSFAQLSADEFGAETSQAQLSFGAYGELNLTLNGAQVLQSTAQRGFGVCGKKWLFALPYRPSDRFYGMGEKNLGFELSNKRTLFWNTDVFTDFAWAQVEHGSTDPMYASLPVLIIKTGGVWLAIVVDNPFAVFMNTGANEDIFQPGAAAFVPELFFGARDGQPDFWLIADTDPQALVRKIQALQGRTPVPPLWALGHQQCRWGYQSNDDLTRIADGYAQRQIPNDGLWLDIDYMDGFRVFTIDATHFTDPVAQIAALTRRGLHVVPILDPGLRRDPAYSVYATAKAADLLCKTSEGEDFVGYVWPGYTVFPDYSLPECRSFWSDQVAEFTRLGFSGYWIDMNDPSTGSVPLDDMRFGRGKLPHEAWHNQYALGMAVATRGGMLAARPEQRPFVISRSAFLSASRHTALWTGDNMANPHHMKNSIALTLNLSVSGLPFNGPDVPGFGLNASAELMRAWYKLGFLFPFLRNHNQKGQPDQEPWTRDAETTAVVTDYIRLRYKLLPYLYNLFLDQAALGDPILRPVWYHDSAAVFERTDDVFFVGPAILQAPFVELEATSRSVQLPRHANGMRWFDVMAGEFVAAGSMLSKINSPATTPLFLASPSLLPMQPGVRHDNRNDLRTIDLLLVIEDGTELTARYAADDGISYAFENGERSVLEVVALASNGRVDLAIRVLQDGFGPIALRVLLLDAARGGNSHRSLHINGVACAVQAEPLTFAGSALQVLATVRTAY